MTKYVTVEAMKKVDEFCKKADEVFGTNLLGKVDVEFGLCGLTAGTALYKRSGNHVIDLNIEGLQKFEHEMLNETIPHEIAHLVVRAVHGYRKNGKKVQPHGKEFKAVCRVLGCSEETYHSMDLTPARKTREFMVTSRCGRIQSKFTSVRINKMRRKGTVYNLRGVYKFDANCPIVEIK